MAARNSAERWFGGNLESKDRSHEVTEPDISIVIPSYNGMPYLKNAVTSALEQRDCRIEVVVVNNASTDDSASYLRTLTDDRLRVVTQPELVDVFQNWSDAISATSAPFVKLLCADDVIPPNSCEQAIKALLQHPDAVMAANKRRIIDDRGRTILAARGLDGLEDVNSRQEVARAFMAAGTNVIGEPSAVVFRTDAIAGELPWSNRWPYLVDADMYLRVLKHGSLVCLSQVGSDFRLTTGGWSNDLLSEQAAQFTGWASELAADGDLGITADDVKSASRAAARNARRRKLIYRALKVRAATTDRLRRA